MESGLSSGSGAESTCGPQGSSSPHTPARPAPGPRPAAHPQQNHEAESIRNNKKIVCVYPVYTRGGGDKPILPSRAFAAERSHPLLCLELNTSLEPQVTLASRWPRPQPLPRLSRGAGVGILSHEGGPLEGRWTRHSRAPWPRPRGPIPAAAGRFPGVRGGDVSIVRCEGLGTLAPRRRPWPVAAGQPLPWAHEDPGPWMRPAPRLSWRKQLGWHFLSSFLISFPSLAGLGLFSSCTGHFLCFLHESWKPSVTPFWGVLLTTLQTPPRLDWCVHRIPRLSGFQNFPYKPSGQ